MEGLPGLTFRMKSFVLVGFFILIGFCLLDHAGAGGAEWKFLEKDDEGSWFYDSTNIECLSNDDNCHEIVHRFYCHDIVHKRSLTIE